MRHSITILLTALAMILGLAACIDALEAPADKLGTTTLELQQGPPRIISTSISPPECP